ncbi:hypothetical protein [Venatoribacter cucullus]|uniref:hypothetical protein n=1 Tax=Venatoribacter cucullus TaxID=2661630 RepID=UPI001E3FBDE2|nr:hypothetical protein [Venatoribacter cucullus]
MQQPQNAATYFIKHSTTSWMLVLILLVGGISSYLGWGGWKTRSSPLKKPWSLPTTPVPAHFR